jgi:peptide deformylase
MLRAILHYPNPELKKISEKVSQFDEELKKLSHDMKETMYAAPGIGLAAPQIGVPLRVILVDLTAGGKDGQLYVAVNPEILEKHGEQYGEEGCLSVPDIYESVSCPQRIVLRAQNLEGEFWELEAEDLLARCFCHEIDHLNGILFIDRLSPLKRSLAKRKLKRRMSSAM